MKNIIKFLTICIFVCSVSSCLTSKQSVTVSGTPGTEIFTSPGEGLEKLGAIGNEGKTTIKLSRKGYIPYLLSYDKNTNKYYPMGVDYKYTSTLVKDITLGILTSGLYFLLDLGYIDSKQFEEEFRYLDNQTISSAIPNAPYANTGERREVANRTASSGLLSKASTSSSTSKLLRKDYSKQLQGEYIGNGKLLQKENVVETYRNMKVVMSSVDRNTMTVEILMDGNEAVFAPCDYNIKSQGNNNFVLTSKEDSSNKIIIKGNKIIYNNPNVRIDGEKYNLQITANITR